MKNFIEAAQYAFAALGGAVGAVMGGFDGFLYALIVFVVVDYLTGVMAAVLNKKLSSEVGFHGIFKKVVIFALWRWGISWMPMSFKTGASSVRR